MKPLPTIYMVRHGETEWSRTGRHTSRTDLPLTPAGETAAGPLRDKLAGIPFARVLTSPLLRARHTAQLAGFPDAQPNPELIEWQYGDYEGMTTAEIRIRQPNWNLFTDGCPGGESASEIAARADRVVATLRADDGDTLLFAHGHFLRVLAARWLGQGVPFAGALMLGTGTVSVLGFDHASIDEPAIIRWNC